MNSAFTATVTGRVQLVMYRDFVQRKARAMGIVGMVKNNNDGSVVVVAEGERTKLDTLLEYMKRGSVLARVDAVTVEWSDPKGIFQTFSIQY